MKSVILSLSVVGVLISAFQAHGAANQADLLECDTEHSSIYVGLVADGKVAQFIVTPQSGSDAQPTSYISAELSNAERLNISTGSWGISAVSADGKKLILVVQDGKDATVVSEGYPTSAVCKKP